MSSHIISSALLVYHISHQPFAYSHHHLCLCHHCSLCTDLHTHCHSSTLTPLTLNTIPTVPMKNHFPHPPVVTTPARPLDFFLSCFKLGFLHHHYVTKGRWQLGLCLMCSTGNIIFVLAFSIQSHSYHSLCDAVNR